MLYVVQEFFGFIWGGPFYLDASETTSISNKQKCFKNWQTNLRRKQTRLVVASHPVKTNQTEMQLDLGKPSNSNDKQIV